MVNNEPRLKRERVLVVKPREAYQVLVSFLKERGIEFEETEFIEVIEIDGE